MAIAKKEQVIQRKLFDLDQNDKKTFAEQIAEKVSEIRYVEQQLEDQRNLIQLGEKTQREKEEEVLALQKESKEITEQIKKEIRDLERRKKVFELKRGKIDFIIKNQVNEHYQTPIDQLESLDMNQLNDLYSLLIEKNERTIQQHKLLQSNRQEF